jgi:hypothetical protein
VSIRTIFFFFYYYFLLKGFYRFAYIWKKNILQNVNAYLNLQCDFNEDPLYFLFTFVGNLSITIYMHLIAYSSIFLCFTYCFS